jgi:hypothetical protein
LSIFLCFICIRKCSHVSQEAKALNIYFILLYCICILMYYTRTGFPTFNRNLSVDVDILCCPVKHHNIYIILLFIIIEQKKKIIMVLTTDLSIKRDCVASMKYFSAEWYILATIRSNRYCPVVCRCVVNHITTMINSAIEFFYPPTRYFLTYIHYLVKIRLYNWWAEIEMTNNL